MATDELVSWNIKVTKETDQSMRSFLDSQGMETGDLSKFVEDAVLKQVFHRMIEDIHGHNRDVDPDKITAEIEAAIREVRSEARDRIPNPEYGS